MPQRGTGRLTGSAVQRGLGARQGQEAPFLEVLGGQVAGDGGRPQALLPHEVAVLEES